MMSCPLDRYDYIYLSNYVDKDVISARFENDEQTPKTRSLCSVKNCCFTFNRIIRFAVRERERERKRESMLECLVPHAKSNTLRVTGIPSDNHSKRKCIVSNWTDSRLPAETKWPTLFDKRKVLLESGTTSGRLR